MTDTVAVPWVVMVKLAVDAPAGTVTLVGVAAALGVSLDRLTTAPPDGAAPLSVTVPVALYPIPTVVGLSANDNNSTAGGVTVSGALRVVPKEAEIVVGVEVLT